MRLPASDAGKLENAAVPADAGGGIGPAQRIEALAGRAGSFWKGNSTAQSCGRSTAFQSLSSNSERPTGTKLPVLEKFPAAEIEILGRIAGVAEMETPAEIEQQALPVGVALLRLIGRDRVRLLLFGQRRHCSSGGGRHHASL